MLRIDSGQVTEAGSGQPSGHVIADLGEQLVVPGFVDIHVHVESPDVVVELVHDGTHDRNLNVNDCADLVVLDESLTPTGA